MAKWKPVKPAACSNPAFFKGEDREWILRQHGFTEHSPYKRVVPTQFSDYKHFMLDNEWKGIADFKQRIQDNADKINLLDLIEPYPHKDEGGAVYRSFETTVTSYPHSDKFYYTTRVERINLDKERIRDFGRGKGIKIEKPQGVKKDIKDPNSIYSPMFGPTFEDASSYGNRYSCSCGLTTTQQNEGTICPNCGTKVIRKNDDFSIFGWIVLNDDVVIHPGLYKSIEFFIDKSVLNNILNIKNDKDENGFSIAIERPENEPFMDYGMLGFYEHFDEIMEFYLKLNPGKKEYYDDIMHDRDKVFTHSIPVFTTLLRPYHLIGEKFAFEDLNKNFNIMAMFGYMLNNKESLKTKRAKKTHNQLLYDLQYNLMEVYDEVVKIMSSKKGIIRSLYGGRYNFTCRAVIVPNWHLRSDQIKVPYKALVKLLEHSIINILHNTYGMPLHVARSEWDRAFVSYDQRIWNIINYIIKANPEGIPFIINRNPTLNYGSILQMFCVGISDNDPDNYTMEIPLLILPLLNADFDGDKN